VIELVKEPDPVPSDVFVDKAIVGFIDVDQQTPRPVIEEPPSEVILPPDVAVVAVIDEIDVVVNVGKFTDVVKFISDPYEVPLVLVA
jgi:hypothetical protein